MKSWKHESDASQTPNSSSKNVPKEYIMYKIVIMLNSDYKKNVYI